MKPRLQEKFETEVVPAMAEKFGRTNIISLPKLQKIVVNMGVGSAATEKKHIDDAVSSITELTGQKPMICRARKSLATFKLREGQPIGCKVTLRGQRMFEFLDRLVSIALPRVRDFRGINQNSFDGNGNYTMGLAERTVFAELNADKYLRPQGLDITFVTSSSSNAEALELLTLLGMPFKKDDDPE
ncbi:MAG: 50S ribosomal protein L5 [Blastopirellula sp.]|nr:MAG: 50S ribosomal protein L5 [Blastopirellula sp.]